MRGLVEAAQHGGKGVADLDVGIAPERFGDDARLEAVGLVLQVAVTAEAVADHAVVEPPRRQEDGQREQRGRRIVDSQGAQQQQEEHRLADDGRHRPEHARHEREAHHVHVAHEHRGVRVLQKAQAAVVVMNVETP